MVRKLAVETLVTLDGVFQDPGGFGETQDGGWSDPYFDDDALQTALDHLRQADMFLCGRVTYEVFKDFWPQGHDTYANLMNELPKRVASTTLSEPLEWNARLIEGDVAEEIAEVKRQRGGDIVMYGSATLVGTLMKHDLVDEYLLWVHPLVLGRGKRVFTGSFDKTTLRLVDTKTLGTGVVIMRYAPDR